jgi:hypothetical protein
MRTPIALFLPEDTVYGQVFHPANRVAQELAALANVRTIPADRMQHIRNLGFEVAYPNGQAIPFPKDAYRRKPSNAPQHILDEA